MCCLSQLGTGSVTYPPPPARGRWTLRAGRRRVRLGRDYTVRAGQRLSALREALAPHTRSLLTSPAILAAFFLGGHPRLKVEEVVYTPGNRFRLQASAPALCVIHSMSRLLSSTFHPGSDASSNAQYADEVGGAGARADRGGSERFQKVQRQLLNSRRSGCCVNRGAALLAFAVWGCGHGVARMRLTASGQRCRAAPTEAQDLMSAPAERRPKT